MSDRGNWGLQDFTQLMTLENRQSTIFDKLGLIDEFDKHFLTGTFAQFERITDGEDAIQAKARGGDRNYAGRENARKEVLETAFFPLDGKVTPQDIEDLRMLMLGTEAETESVANRIRKLVGRLQRSHAQNFKRAMYKMLKEDKTYFPSIPAKEKAFSTIWGVTRKVVPAGTFDLTNQAVDPFETLEVEGRRHIIDNFKGQVDEFDIVFLCGSGVFDKLVGHSKFEATYADDPLLRERFGGMKVNRILRHKGFLIVEDIDRNDGIANDKGYMFPLGLPTMFNIAYSPADTNEHMGTVAEESYLFLEEGLRHTTAQSESSFVIMNSLPELLVEFSATLT